MFEQFVYLKLLFIWSSNPKRQIFDKLFSNLFNLILMLGNYSKLQQLEAYWSSTACVWQMRTSSLIYAIISLSSLLFSALSHYFLMHLLWRLWSSLELTVLHWSIYSVTFTSFWLLFFIPTHNMSSFFSTLSSEVILDFSILDPRLSQKWNCRNKHVHTGSTTGVNAGWAASAVFAFPSLV